MRLIRQFLAAGTAVSVLGCATQTPTTPPAASPPSTLEATAGAMATAAGSLVGSTRGEVLAALGPATVIRFDSGYEVWLYRFVEPAARKSERERAGANASPEEPGRDRRPSELVMLFTPSGVVDKVRVRAETPAS